jgi:Uma2 family endonuclease
MQSAQKYRPYYTYENYCEWEGRWELIDGIPYAMSPLPVPAHQLLSLSLSTIFKEALKKCKHCKVYPPLDWKITDDTVVQPDVLIVCKKIEKKFLDFPPVLVIEVLSPSTASKDRNEKMELYQMQKVKYYLIADAQFKKIEIYQLLDDQYQPVSVNPDSFEFTFDENCTASITFDDLWD